MYDRWGVSEMRKGVCGYLGIVVELNCRGREGRKIEEMAWISGLWVYAMLILPLFQFPVHV